MGSVNHESLPLTGRAMGLAPRLAGGLADDNLDQQAAGDAVENAQAAIGRHEWVMRMKSDVFSETEMGVRRHDGTPIVALSPYHPRPHFASGEER